jgi:hypothetical protein
MEIGRSETPTPDQVRKGSESRGEGHTVGSYVEN